MLLIINNMQQVKDLYPANHENIETALKLLASYLHDIDKQFNATDIKFNVTNIYFKETNQVIGSMEVLFKRAEQEV